MKRHEVKPGKITHVTQVEVICPGTGTMLPREKATNRKDCYCPECGRRVKIKAYKPWRGARMVWHQIAHHLHAQRGFYF